MRNPAARGYRTTEMSRSARLLPTNRPDSPRGAVLVLHGGASRGDGMAVSPAQLSVLRMIPVAKRIAWAGNGRLAVFRLLNSFRGWDASHTPVDDAAWAVDRIRKDYDDLPVCLIGHSLGGRAALLAASRPGVRSVAALNPWVYPSDRPDLRGRQALIVHGSADRVADPRRSRAVADAVGRRTPVGYITVPGGRHAMLRHHTLYERFAAEFAVGTVLGDPQSGPVGRVLAGERWVDA